MAKSRRFDNPSPGVHKSQEHKRTRRDTNLRLRDAVSLMEDEEELDEFDEFDDEFVTFEPIRKTRK